MVIDWLDDKASHHKNECIELVPLPRADCVDPDPFRGVRKRIGLGNAHDGMLSGGIGTRRNCFWAGYDAKHRRYVDNHTSAFPRRSVLVSKGFDDRA